MSKPENPPLFDLVDPGDSDSSYCTGITLRDLFAAAANVPWDVVVQTFRSRGIPEREITLKALVQKRAGMRFAEADAMLAERAK